jgi:exonuclease VII large subunit
MFRKHFRFKRFALGLAFAAMALPVAPAGAVGLSNSVNGPSQFYKQQQEQMSKAISDLSSSVNGPSQFYKQQQEQMSKAISDLSNSVNGPAQFYKQQQEQMSQAISDLRNSVKRPDPSLVPQTVLSTSSGFDWKDAGIGASTVLATALLLGIALIVTRRRHHTGLTSA